MIPRRRRCRPWSPASPWLLAPPSPWLLLAPGPLVSLVLASLVLAVLWLMGKEMEWNVEWPGGNELGAGYS